MWDLYPWVNYLFDYTTTNKAGQEISIVSLFSLNFTELCGKNRGMEMRLFLYGNPVEMREKCGNEGKWGKILGTLTFVLLYVDNLTGNKEMFFPLIYAHFQTVWKYRSNSSRELHRKDFHRVLRNSMEIAWPGTHLHPSNTSSALCAIDVVPWYAGHWILHNLSTPYIF